MYTLLELLEQDCTQSPAQLAAQAGMTEAQVKDELTQLEESGAILGYQAIIDWDRVKRESVTALIEVKVVPQSLDGFDRIAERIYQYDEVESMYLMSGAFDLTVIISGRTLREVAQFVASAWPSGGSHRHRHPLHFEEIQGKHLVFRRPEPLEREFVFS